MVTTHAAHQPARGPAPCGYERGDARRAQRAEHGQRGAGADVEAVGDPDRQQALDRGERERRELLGAQRRLEQPHGRRRDDQHDGHQQRADGVERHHDGDRDARAAAAGRRAPSRTPTERAPSGRSPSPATSAAARRRRISAATTARRGQPQVERRQRDQRAEQQPVHARARVVDVAARAPRRSPARRRAAGRSRRPGRSGACAAARSSTPPNPTAQTSAASCAGNPPRPGDDEPGKGRGPDRVRVERQPPQHDPRPEHAREHGQQQDLDDPALDVRDAQVSMVARSRDGRRGSHGRVRHRPGSQPHRR